MAARSQRSIAPEITVRERIIFAAGDIFGGGGANLIAVLYLIFLTDVVRLEPGLAGTAILVAKLWDAINDPLTGALSDRTRTRFGRRRPWIFVGALLLIFGMSLLWMPDGPGETQLQKMIWAMASYLIYNTIATIQAVPYASMSTEVTTDPGERNKVNVLRLVFSTVAGASVTLVATQLVSRYQHGQLGQDAFYRAIVFGFGTLFTVPMLAVALFTRERVPLPPHPEPLHFFRGFLSPLRVPAMRSLMGMYLCQALAMDIITATILYYSRYVVRGISSTVFLGLFIAIQLLAFPVINHLVKHHSKNRIYYLLLPLAVGAIVGLGLYPRGGPVLGVYALAGVLAVGMVGALLLSWVIFPDVLDAAELVTGQRNAGSFGGLMTFTRGLATAVMIQVVGLVLQFTGYRAPGAGGSATQPDSAVWGIRLVLMIGVATLLSAGWLVARRYPLSWQRCQEQKVELERRRTEADAVLVDRTAPAGGDT